MSRPSFLRKLRKYVAALPALAFGFMGSPAFSTIVTIDASGVIAGSTSASFLGATLTSVGGKFTKSDTTGTNPRTVIGVSKGYLDKEVDLSDEAITLDFGPLGAKVSEITLGLLFRNGVSGNVVDEAAELLSNGGTGCASGVIMPCILSAAGVWRGSPASVTTLSPATAGNGGIFKITNPFPVSPGSPNGELISSILFNPRNIFGVGAANSDFALVSVVFDTNAVLVPEPETLTLVSLGMLGLAFAGRRARG